VRDKNSSRGEPPTTPYHTRKGRLRTAVALALLLAPLTVSPTQAAPSGAAVASKRAPLRLIVLRDGDELLGSERRALAQVERALAARLLLDAKLPSAAEEAFVRSCFAGPCDHSVPPSLASLPSVLALRVAPYAPAEKGKRLSGGFADILLWRAGEKVPLFQASVDNGAALPVQSPSLGAWLSELVLLGGEP
jgi:hypothetical protein